MTDRQRCTGRKYLLLTMLKTTAQQRYSGFSYWWRSTKRQNNDSKDSVSGRNDGNSTCHGKSPGKRSDRWICQV